MDRGAGKLLVPPLLETPAADEAGESVSVTFLPEETTIEARSGKTVLESARYHGVHLPHACNGRSRCGTCRVRVLAGNENLNEIDAVERRMLMRYGICVPGIRLGCRCRPEGPATLEILMTPEEAHASWNQHRSSRWKPRGGWK